MVEFKNSDIDFQVGKVPYFYNFGGNITPSKKVASLIREDNGIELGYCGKRYQPIQNETIFNFVNNVFENETNIELIKSFEDGATNMLFSEALDDLEFVTQTGDKVQKRIFAMFNHTAGFSVRFGITERVSSCQNVFPTLIKQSAFRVTHDNLSDSKLNLGKELFQVIREENRSMNELYSILEANSIQGTVKDKHIEDIVKYVLEIPTKKIIDDLSTRTKNKIATIVSSVESELASKGNNLWGLFNGITYYANHIANESKILSPDQKIYRTHLGSENYMMNRALQYCKKNVELEIEEEMFE